jgi:hypothetical protein
MVQPSAAKCSCIANFVSLVGSADITLCVASQRVILKVSAYFVIDSVRNIWIHHRMYILENFSSK